MSGWPLDDGTHQYLPAMLRRFVLARDGGCRAPGCGVTSPRRLEMDHAVEYPTGPSSAANTGAACTTDHQLKTGGRLRITDARPDGSCTWTTAWGQSVHVPARPFLHDPRHEMHRSAAATEERREPACDPDPPPF